MLHGLLNTLPDQPSGKLRNTKPSPCRKICRLDEATGKCVGCGRTLDQIKAAGDAAQKAADARRLEVDGKGYGG